MGSKPTSRKEKKLTVLNNFTSLKTCYYIMREMKDASTDIIVVSNELFCKEEIAKDFDKHLSRGCNIIEVTSLQPISIMQRIVYALLEKNSFVARDADHIVFTLLSEYSRGAATIVHMLTSLMQKSEDNSRTGFELAKQQLKLHIAHLKSEQFFDGWNAILDYSVDMAQSEPLMTYECDDVSTSSLEPKEIFISETIPSCANDDMKEEADVSQSKSYESQLSSIHKTQSKVPGDNDPDTGFISMDIQNEIYVMPHTEDVPHHSNNENHSDILNIKPEGYKGASSASKYSSKRRKVKATEVVQVHALNNRRNMPSSIINKITDSVAGNDGKQIASSNATWPPTTTKPSKEYLGPAHEHPLYMYINDILTNNISLLAYHLLNSLVITGPIPLPLFYVEELNNVVMNAVSSQERKAESPIKELAKLGIVRSSPYPIVYHRNLHPDYIDTNIQLMFIPKLICDAVKDQMDYADKALSILSIQHTLEGLLTNETKPNSIHLRYIFILCNQLDDVCSHVSDHLLTTNLKLKLQILQLLRQ